MARRTVTFAGETTKSFVANQRRGSEYNATIQNLTDQSITITATNDDIQGDSPTFAASGLVVAAGALGSLTAAYDGWLLTASGPANGTVSIVEAG